MDAAEREGIALSATALTIGRQRRTTIDEEDPIGDRGRGRRSAPRFAPGSRQWRNPDNIPASLAATRAPDSTRDRAAGMG